MSSTSLLRALNQPLRGPSMGKILRELTCFDWERYCVSLHPTAVRAKPKIGGKWMTSVSNILSINIGQLPKSAFPPRQLKITTS